MIPIFFGGILTPPTLNKFSGILEILDKIQLQFVLVILGIRYWVIPSKIPAEKGAQFLTCWMVGIGSVNLLRVHFYLMFTLFL
jgi:hypothetical protein